MYMYMYIIQRSILYAGLCNWRNDCSKLATVNSLICQSRKKFLHEITGPQERSTSYSFGGGGGGAGGGGWSELAVPV